MHSTIAVLITVPILFIFYKTITHILWALGNAEKARQLGCQLGPQWPERDPLGLLELLDMIKAADEGKELEYFSGCFDKVSAKAGRQTHTMEGKFMRMPYVLTRDPKNIQAILATQFRDFELGPVRLGTFAPLYVYVPFFMCMR